MTAAAHLEVLEAAGVEFSGCPVVVGDVLAIWPILPAGHPNKAIVESSRASWDARDEFHDWVCLSWVIREAIKEGRG